MRSSVIECKKKFFEGAKRFLKAHNVKTLREKGIAMRASFMQTSKKEEIIEAITNQWWDKKIKDENLLQTDSMTGMIIINTPSFGTSDLDFVKTVNEYSLWVNERIKALKTKTMGLNWTFGGANNPALYGPRMNQQNSSSYMSQSFNPHRGGNAGNNLAAFAYNGMPLALQMAPDFANGAVPTDCHCCQPIPETPQGLPTGVLKCKILSCKRRFHKKCYGIIQNEQCKDFDTLECISCVLRSNDPLHKTCHAFMERPFILKPRESSQMTTDTIPIRITDHDYQTIKGSINKCLEIRCMKLDGIHLYEQTWPDEATVFFRNNPLKEFKPLEVKSSLKKRKDEKLIIPLSLLVIGQNDLRIRYRNIQDNKNTMADTNPHYALSVFLIEKLEPAILCQNIIANSLKTQPIERAKDFISKQFCNGEIKITVSFKCIYTLGVIKTPVRGVYCKHLNPFSLEYFVATFERNMMRKWLCPICRVRCYRIVVDTYLKKIYDQLVQGNPEMTEIDLLPDGSYCVSGSSTVYSPLTSNNSVEMQKVNDENQKAFQVQTEKQISKGRSPEEILVFESQGREEKEQSIQLEIEKAKEKDAPEIRKSKSASDSNKAVGIIDLDDEEEENPNPNGPPSSQNNEVFPFPSQTERESEVQSSCSLFDSSFKADERMQREQQRLGSVLENSLKSFQYRSQTLGINPVIGMDLEKDKRGSLRLNEEVVPLIPQPETSTSSMQIVQSELLSNGVPPNEQQAPKPIPIPIEQQQQLLPPVIIQPSRVINPTEPIQEAISSLGRQQMDLLRDANDPFGRFGNLIRSLNPEVSNEEQNFRGMLENFKNSKIFAQGCCVRDECEKEKESLLQKRLHETLLAQRHFFQTTKQFDDWKANGLAFPKNTLKKIARTKRFHTKIFKKLESKMKKSLSAKKLLDFEERISKEILKHSIHRTKHFEEDIRPINKENGSTSVNQQESEGGLSSSDHVHPVSFIDSPSTNGSTSQKAPEAPEIIVNHQQKLEVFPSPISNQQAPKNTNFPSRQRPSDASSRSSQNSSFLVASEASRNNGFFNIYPTFQGPPPCVSQTSQPQRSVPLGAQDYLSFGNESLQRGRETIRPSSQGPPMPNVRINMGGIQVQRPSFFQSKKTTMDDPISLDD